MAKGAWLLQFKAATSTAADKISLRALFAAAAMLLLLPLLSHLLVILC
jgi:hypothetical protein